MTHDASVIVGGAKTLIRSMSHDFGDETSAHDAREITLIHPGLDNLIDIASRCIGNSPQCCISAVQEAFAFRKCFGALHLEK